MLSTGMGGIFRDRSRSSERMSVYVALLRGINVAGKNKLPMAELVEIFRQCGAERVQTFIQSGNVIFSASSGVVSAVGDRASSAIEEGYGYRIPVVLRSVDQLERSVVGNPFVRAGATESALHVAFLASEPSAERVALLDRHRSAEDRFEVGEQAIYLHCPNGLARTKLTNQYFDSTLRTTSTVRNWRTTVKLLELARAAAAE